jgi:hypothetical protein
VRRSVRRAGRGVGVGFTGAAVGRGATVSTGVATFGVGRFGGLSLSAWAGAANTAPIISTRATRTLRITSGRLPHSTCRASNLLVYCVTATSRLHGNGP